ncbi:MAG: OmpA family protein [Vicinamibacteria bacterium]|nr:OmpA family protein [Vicinamibacteria bacterium]
MKHKAFLSLSALTLAVAATSGFAQTAPAGSVLSGDVRTWIISIDGKDYEARPLTPSFSGSSGLFFLPSAYTVAKGKTSFSLYRNNLDRNPKDLDASTIGVSLGYGLSSKAEIFGTFGIQRNDVDRITDPGYVNNYPNAGRQSSSPGWQTGASDAIIGLKYKFLDDYAGDGVGLALRPTIKLPTASFDKGLGTGKVSFGVDLLLSKSLNNSAELHGAVGFLTNSDPTGFDLGNALRWGVGFSAPVYRKFQIQAEVTGSSYSGGDFKQVNPVDLMIGPALFFGKGFFVRPAYSRNLHFNSTGSSSSATKSGKILSIGYAGAAAGREIYVPPPPPPPPAPPAPRVENRPPTVSLDADKTNVITCDTVGFRANAADPDGDTLTYAWTTSAGRTVGDGANVTLEPGCLPAGTDVVVTVTVNDGHDHSAQASRHVMIEAKPKPPTVTASVGPFPKNSTRLNNIDKSVLDDMASRLRQDPASRLLIVGHAEKGERNPDVLSRKRAEAVRDYMVKQRGIDASRITTRGAGVGGGRRAELTFVPDGAEMPSM